MHAKKASSDVSLTKVAKQSVPQSPQKYYASGGEGKTLPEGVWRARKVAGFIHGNNGYSAGGNKEETGLDFQATAGAAVLEYGLVIV